MGISCAWSGPFRAAASAWTSCRSQTPAACLRQEVDYYFSGFLVPGLVADAANGDRKKRGVMYSVNESKGYGFLSIRTGFGPTDFQSDIFLHIRDFTRNEETVDNAHFALLKTREAILQFELEQQAGGKLKAVNATEFQFARPS